MATTTEATSTAVPAPAGLKRRDEWSIAFFATWMVVGLFLDGWAHNAGKPETFFSPWHGVLYSGFGAAMAYFAVDSWRERRAGRAVEVDRLVVAGLVLFAAAGIGDMVWHQIFGIEEDLEALLSPTHLALMTGGLLLLAGPIRSVWTDRARIAGSFVSFLPTLVWFTLSAALVSFFTMYVSAFHLEGQALSAARTEAGELIEVWGITSILVSNLILVAPMLLILRRWTPPAGAFTFLFGGVALLTSGLDAFDQLPLVGAALIGGAAADVLAPRVGPRVLGALVPLALWPVWFEIYHHSWGVGWAVELWTGSIILASLSGVGLSVLAFPPAGQEEVLDARA